MGVFHELTQYTPLHKQNWLNVYFGKPGRVEAGFNTFYFEDHGHIIVYVPSMNLSAYGNTVEEAMDMLINVVIDDFFESIVRSSEGEAFQQLSKLGWSLQGHSHEREFTNSAYVDKDGILRNFNLPADTPIHQQAITV